MNNALQFCEDLFEQACEQAKGRLQTLPQPEQLQMIDFLRAFNQLKLQAYSASYSQIQGEWNEAMAVIKAYTIANKDLCPEKGVSIAQAIKKWHQYKKLPNEIQNAVEKALQNYIQGYEVFNTKLQHFFDQLHLYGSNLVEPESITGLIKSYRTQVFEAYHKVDHQNINSLLQALKNETTTYSQQLDHPSRELLKLIQWTEQHLPIWTPSKEGGHNKHPDGQTKPRG